VPICRHDIYLSDTTDADEQFPGRNNTYSYDDVTKTGVFSFDLTLKEVKTLGALPATSARDQSYNGKFKARALLCPGWRRAA
jgi:hypothetical protein